MKMRNLKSVAEGLEIRRLLSGGTPDANFGTNGAVVSQFGGVSSFSSVQVLNDNRILAAGQVAGTQGTDFLIARYLQNGQLDPSFGGGDGFVTVDFTSLRGATSNDAVNELALLDDGRFVAAGTSGTTSGNDTSGNDFAVARFLADGTLDPAFAGGRVTADFFGRSDRATTVAVQSDGKVLVAGTVFTDTNIGDFGLARFNADGTPDAGFGSGGKASTDYQSGTDVLPGQMFPFSFSQSLSAISIRPDGKIVIAGDADVCFDCGLDRRDFTIARYTADGKLDLTFNDVGYTVEPFGGHPNRVGNSLVVLGDGRSIVAGGDGSSVLAQRQFAMARYTANGKVDTTFNNGTGYVQTPIGGEERGGAVANTILVLPGGRLLLVGTALDNEPAEGAAPTRVAAARFTADGVLDTSFADTGAFLSSALTNGAAAALLSDGRVVIVGASGDNAGVLQLAADPTGTGVLSGSFYNDTNRNGSRDSGEAPLVGWTAYTDQNANGRLDPGEFYALSGADGSYAITRLPAGNYKVRELRPSEWTRTEPTGDFPAGLYDVTLTNGQTRGNLRFGNYLASTPTPTTPTPTTPTPTSPTPTTPTPTTPTPTTPTPTPTTPTPTTPTPPPVVGTPTPTPAPVVLPASTVIGTSVTSSGMTNVVGGQKAKTSFRVTLSNIGTTRFSGRVPVRLYLSTDNILDTSDVALGSTSKKVKLNPSRTAAVKLNVSRFPTMTDGNYNVLAQVEDPAGGGVVARSSTPVHVATPFIDLTPTPSDPPTQLRASRASNATVLVANLGNVPATGRTALQVYASVDSAFGSEDILIGTATPKLSVAVGKSKRYRVRITPPADLAAGSYRLIVRLNPDNQPAESSLANNIAATPGTFTLI